MTQLMLFSTLDTGGVDTIPLDLCSSYELSSSFDIGNVQVKKDSIRCSINGQTYLLDGFKSIESVLIWNYLYQRMIKLESNYHEFSWDSMCREIGVEMDESLYPLVMHPLLKSSVSEQIRRVTFRHYRTFNALSKQRHLNGDLKFALTLSGNFCSIEPDFQQALFSILLENCSKSFSKSVDDLRKVGRRQYRTNGQNYIRDLQQNYNMATA